MNDKENASLKACRFLLKVGGAILGIFLLVALFPRLLDPLAASSAAKREQFLRPSLCDTNTVDSTNGIFSTVVLSGTYETADGDSGKFEIVTCGHDLYLKREWKTFFGGWRWNVEMAMANFYQNMSVGWRGMGSGGTGQGGYGNANNELLAGRDLWKGTNFVGASNDALKFTNGPNSFPRTEEFSELEKFGAYLIPRKIVFQDNKRQFIYRIEKMQFRNDPTEPWFLEKAKRFGYSLHEEQKSLSEQSGSKTNN
jgi:hypothetical protein